MNHETYMREALRLAETAAMADDVPVGALVVRDGVRLGEGFNCNVSEKDPTGHAEICALRAAGAYVDNYRLPGSILYVSLEPCLMCFSAMIHARIETLVFGAYDPKGGYSQFMDEARLSRLNHRMEVIAGVLEDEASALIREFFREKRRRGKRKWLKT